MHNETLNMDLIQGSSACFPVKRELFIHVYPINKSLHYLNFQIVIQAATNRHTNI